MPSFSSDLMLNEELFAVENNFQVRGSFQKLKCPFCKTNTGQLALSYIGPTFWNKTPDTLKRTKNLNTFKHDLKKYFLNEILILKVLSLRDHNVNTSFYKHVLCHPANNKSVFLSLLVFKSSLILLIV